VCGFFFLAARNFFLLRGKNSFDKIACRKKNNVCQSRNIGIFMASEIISVGEQIKKVENAEKL